MLRELEYPPAYELEAEWLGEVDRRSRDYIHWVQRSLNQIIGAGLAVDGIRGRNTRRAIRSFQRRQGLVVDGIVGSRTEAALIAAGASSPPQVSTGPRTRTRPDSATSRCPRSPLQWAQGKLRKMRRWWRGEVGKTLRKMTPKVFPGMPVEAIVGFCANGNVMENTTERVRGQKFHEIGLFGTEAGHRDGPAPNPDPRAKYNSWGRLASNRLVKRLLGGRSATMRHNAWKRAISDQVAVGLVNVHRHGRNVARKLDPAIRPDVNTSSSLFFIACCFMGWSAGDGRAAEHLNRFKHILMTVPEEKRWGAFLRALAEAVELGRLDLRGCRKHKSAAYSAQRTWQKLTAGQLLARETGGAVEWFDTGLGDDEAQISETITCAGNVARRTPRRAKCRAQ